MTQSTPGVTPEAPERIHTTEEDDGGFLSRDLQERFGLLLLAYNEAHHDLLDAPRPSAIRRTEDPGIFEIELAGQMTTSTLTAAVTVEEGNAKLEPLDIRTTSCLGFFPVLSHDRECTDAHVIRMMACWLERAFLVHEAAILELLSQDAETASHTFAPRPSAEAGAARRLPREEPGSGLPTPDPSRGGRPDIHGKAR